jgi:hypothetical protein
LANPSDLDRFRALSVHSIQNRAPSIYPFNLVDLIAYPLGLVDCSSFIQSIASNYQSLQEDIVSDATRFQSIANNVNRASEGVNRAPFFCYPLVLDHLAAIHWHAFERAPEGIRLSAIRLYPLALGHFIVLHLNERHSSILSCIHGPVDGFEFESSAIHLYIAFDCLVG